MSTRIYGASDDLIEFEGDIVGEVDCYDEDILAAISDGTILLIHYGKPGLGSVWSITVLHKGAAFERLDVCTDGDAAIYSDVAHFRDGKLRAWVGKFIERVH